MVENDGSEISLRGELGKGVQRPLMIRRSILPYLAWGIALISTVGSLFFSEVMGLPPCVLCWYQRIAMYPLVVIIGIGIILRDSRMRHYALPVCLIGLAISIYHNLLYYGIIPESIIPCTMGISCTSRQIEWLGFITIPLMALVAFVGLTLCLLFYKSVKEER
jgi:disulfide bond formation protein DsbB